MGLRQRLSSDPVIGLEPFACKWPIGSPGAPGFHFCAERAVDGEVYCHRHCCAAYPGYREKYGE